MRSLLSLLLLTGFGVGPALASEVVPVQSFGSVELRGGGSVVVVPGARQRVTLLEGSSAVTHVWIARDGQLRIDVCNQHCPRNYHLRVQIEAPHVPSVAVLGGGQISVASGFTPQPELSAAINGGGRINAAAVAAASVSAAVNGGGELIVRASRSLSAAVRGGGSIRYSGSPRVSTAIMGGGSVRAVN